MIVGNLGDQRVFVWELTRLVLRVDKHAVHMHIENAAATLDEPRRCRESIIDLGRQTDRRRFIVSLYAVGDRSIHRLG